MKVMGVSFSWAVLIAFALGTGGQRLALQCRCVGPFRSPNVREICHAIWVLVPLKLLVRLRLLKGCAPLNCFERIFLANMRAMPAGLQSADYCI